MKKFDLIILGQGSAAFAGAIKANDLGIKTAMIGGNATKGTVIGGTCVNVGCMPSKRLITVATNFYDTQKNHWKGIKYGKSNVDFKKVIAQKDEMVKKFRKEKYADVINELKNVTYFNGKGNFVSKNQVKIENQIIEGKKFLIAVGARTFIPKIKGIESIDYLTNEEALGLEEVPKSLCIMGAGALGLEFAQLYAHFGTKVTLLQRSERILSGAEPEISEYLKKYLEDEGIRILTGANINFVKRNKNQKIINVNQKGKKFNVICEQFLIATGRTPNIDNLGLDKVKVKTDDKGFIQVNNEMQTSNPNIWAAGDVIGEPMLETIAAKEGAVAVENAFTDNKKKIDFTEVPKAVFTYPEAASVGLTDSEANAKGIKCICKVMPFELVPKAHVIGDTRGVIKIVMQKENKQIVGVHILAPHAADLIHEATLAVKFKLTIDDIIDTVHVFPTLSEATKLAAQSFYKDVSKLSCCTE